MEETLTDLPDLNLLLRKIWLALKMNATRWARGMKITYGLN